MQDDEEVRAALAERWRSTWPDVPVGRFGGWSVRFHSLPDHGDLRTAEHMEHALHRHAAVLTQLTIDSNSESLVSLTYDWSEQEQRAPAAPAGTSLWVSNAPDEWSDAWEHVYLATTEWDVATARVLVRDALEAESQLVLTDSRLSWLYAPYDGGCDVGLPDRRKRDLLYGRFAEWAAPWNHWHPIAEWQGPDLRR